MLLEWTQEGIPDKEVNCLYEWKKDLFACTYSLLLHTNMVMVWQIAGVTWMFDFS